MEKHWEKEMERTEGFFKVKIKAEKAVSQTWEEGGSSEEVGRVQLLTSGSVSEQLADAKVEWDGERKKAEVS